MDTTFKRIKTVQQQPILEMQTDTIEPTQIISYLKFEKSFKKIKYRKAARYDGITPEMVKFMGETGTQKVCQKTRELL